MKKHTLKKLVLNRETLAELDRMDLAYAAGGGTHRTCNPDDYGCFSGQATCGTCQLTCTTNRC